MSVILGKSGRQPLRAVDYMTTRQLPVNFVVFSVFQVFFDDMYGQSSW